MIALKSHLVRTQLALWSLAQARLPGFDFGLPARSQNPYVTHIPALLAISKLIQPRRVIEFGCGRYSTLTFLNPVAFPALVELSSYENDATWVQNIGDEVGNEPRLHLHLVDGPMHVAAQSCALGQYDLILIDDSASAEERARTIQTVCSQASASSVIAIHDFEIPLYRRSLPAGMNMRVFDAYMPLTGLCWTGRRLESPQFAGLNKAMRRCRHLNPEDIVAWRHVFDSVS